MIIREKGLCRAMKEDYKNSGYVAVGFLDEADEKCIAVLGAAGEWTAQFYERNEEPRKVLALIVEHTGKLPETGEAWRVSKGDTQTMLYSTAMDVLNRVANAVLEDGTEEIKRTDLTWQGNEIWQRPADKGIAVMDPGHMDIVAVPREGGKMVAGGILFGDSTSSAFIMRNPIREENNLMIRCLEKVQWVMAAKRSDT